MRHGFFTAALAVAVATALPVAAPADAIDDALEQLNVRHIAFTVEEFIDVAERNDFEGVRIFLQAGMDPNTTKNGLPLLLELSVKGFKDTAKVLLEGGAMANVKNERGWTPLHMAVFFGHLEVAQLLLEHGADVKARTEYGMTPLHFATQERNPEMMELLLKKGASVTVKSRSGISPLSIAVDLGEKPILKVYEAHGYGDRMKAIRAGRRTEDAATKAEVQRKADERQKKFDERMKEATGTTAQ